MSDQHQLLSRLDLSTLYKPFVAKLETLLERCVERGAIYVATCGERTWAEQDALYAKGRTVAPIGAGHIVTKAKGGQSPHNYAIAVDFCRHADSTFTGKLKPDYRDASYEILAEEAEKLGLDPGLRWKFKDSPHIQLPVKQKGYTWAQLADIYRKGGKKALFAELDKHTW
jgi:peptidoglycan L-alanyl-D-glutamate endopeptidase CwlK